MTSKRLFFALCACLGLLLVALVGVGYGADKILGMRATKLNKLKADAEVVATAQQALAKNKQDIAKYSELNDIAKSIVPQDKDQAEAVQEIVKLATESGIPQLSSVTFPASTLGSSAALSGTSSSASSSSASTTPKPSTGLTQVTPVPGINGVYDLQITITQDANSRVPYKNFRKFLGLLEQNRRTAQVSSINIQPDTKNPDMIAFTLVIDEFIKP